MMRRRDGFTLIELLVVVAIIVVLIAMLMPALNKARTQTKQVSCLSNMKQIGTGFFLYAQENNGHLPLGWASGSVAAVSNPTYSSDPRAIREGGSNPVVGLGRLARYLGFTRASNPTYSEDVMISFGLGGSMRPKYFVDPAGRDYMSKPYSDQNTGWSDYVYWRDGLAPSMDTTYPWAHFGQKLDLLNNRNLSFCAAANARTSLCYSVGNPGGHMDGANFVFGDGHAEYMKRTQYTAYSTADWTWWEEDTRWRH